MQSRGHFNIITVCGNFSSIPYCLVSVVPWVLLPTMYGRVHSVSLLSAQNHSRQRCLRKQLRKWNNLFLHNLCKKYLESESGASPGMRRFSFLCNYPSECVLLAFPNVSSFTIRALSRILHGTICLACSRLSVSIIAHPQCAPSWQPHSK